MEIVLMLIVFQGLLGAFDLIYHHEFLERLPWRKTAARELQLHSVRNFLYGVVFLSLGWVAWHGVWAWVFGAILAVEVFITLWDFVEEDLSRKLPATERVSHTILALNYGAVLAAFAPLWLEWAGQPTGFVTHNYGWLSWLMALYAVGTVLWGFRDLWNGIRLGRTEKAVQTVVPVLDKPGQRILVAGGTGFIGAPLCRLLIGQGHRITVITRDMGKAAKQFRGRVTLVENIDSLTELDGFDAIVNLTGEGVAQRWTEAAKERVLQSRLQTTQALIRYLERAREKPEVFIHASAIGIYGLSEDKTFDEDSPLNAVPVSFSEEVCFAREASTRPVEAMGIRTCQLRIGLVIEKDGGMLSRLLFPFEFGMGGRVGKGRQWMSWIHLDDMIGLIYHVINDKEINGAFNAVAPGAVTQGDFAKGMGRAMCRPALMPLPTFVVKLLFGRMGEEFLLAGQRVLPKRAEASGYVFRYPELGGALQAIFGRRKHG